MRAPGSMDIYSRARGMSVVWIWHPSAHIECNFRIRLRELTCLNHGSSRSWHVLVLSIFQKKLTWPPPFFGKKTFLYNFFFHFFGGKKIFKSSGIKSNGELKSLSFSLHNHLKWFRMVYIFWYDIEIRVCELLLDILRWLNLGVIEVVATFL